MMRAGSTPGAATPGVRCVTDRIPHAASPIVGDAFEAELVARENATRATYDAIPSEHSRREYIAARVAVRRYRAGDVW